MRNTDRKRCSVPFATDTEQRTLQGRRTIIIQPKVPSPRKHAPEHRNGRITGGHEKVMIEFTVKSKKQTVGKKKGQNVWYAHPKAKQNFTNKMVIDRIVRETSLSAGDVSNALISLGAIVRDALLMGASVDLGDLGSFRVYVPSKMADNEIDVCAETLKAPKIIFTPKTQMREAAKNVELSVDNPKRKKKKENNGTTPGGGASEHP